MVAQVKQQRAKAKGEIAWALRVMANRVAF
jgi:hypothetical protein